MFDFASLAFGRRSIRKFQDRDIPVEDLEHFIRVAASAPSGCNSQCWKFVAIKDREIINSIADAVIKKVDGILEINKDELPESYIASKHKMVSFFVKAPAVIAVFMTRLDFYDPVLEEAFRANGLSRQDVMELLAYPDLLSIGAAVQNLLLAVHEKGYGACWMSEPAIAGKDIARILGIPEDHRFISLIPVGVPAYTPREKKLKDFNEICSMKI